MNPATTLPSADLIVEPPCHAPGGLIEFGCQLELPQSRQRLWFRFPPETARLATLRADPFVLATAVYAIGRVRRVRIHGAVSDGLLANLADFQAAHAAFHGVQAPPIEYAASMQPEPSLHATNRGGITAFSGGVDSCFSVFRHTSLSPLAPKRPLAAALMMHGFDIPVDEPDVYARSVARSRRLTDSAGLMLHTGVTNVRVLPVPWEDTFGAAVAAALSFFQPAYAFGLVPSFQDWAQAHFDHGSNPLTDPLLSSLSFAVIHDGAGYGRIDKLRHLTTWPAALREMRVCWQGDRLDRNCCRCEKCLRTMLMLRLCGVDSCEAFPEPLERAALDQLVIRNTSGLHEFAYLIEAARAQGVDQWWVGAAERALRRNRRNQRLWRQGRALANLVPPAVHRFLRRGGHRWLWKARSVPPLPGQPAARAAGPT